jgi:hypothetical protein
LHHGKIALLHATRAMSSSLPKKKFVVIEINDVTSMLSNAETFAGRPSLKQIEGLRSGDAVKICVPVPGERFWCIIHAVNGHSITAEVNNELVTVPWPVGMKLKFHRDCIFAVDSGVKTDKPYSRLHNQRLVAGKVHR